MSTAINSSYTNQQVGRLLAAIKSNTLALREEDHGIFDTCLHESFVDMVDITRRACECMAWADVTEKKAEKYKRGKCGEWEYTITGCCCADVSIYNPKTGKQLDVQAYEDGYKLMYCDDTTAAFTDRTHAIRAIAYFMLTEKPDPSVKWIDDPEVFGQPNQAQGWW